ncbi:MAG: putative pyruvate, phosphate dikinase regulatory protein [Alphaproteobacteria bacterium MarineAlpha3_Bin5]|nr:phosphoenolpyruvate synthase regulatory protein [Magnetovibrio sp.]PPR77159.1 MAG: putative pyruvate, phosphate dikinase regulatory protein [Alphaproteobacteria bacterium MarineAlpha3_Bin5]
MTSFHLHLVSDSTGETISLIARACMVLFNKAKPVEHLWSMVRKTEHVEQLTDNLKENKGIVLYTLVDADIREKLEENCRRLGIPCVSVLDPIISALGAYLGAKIQPIPGQQHAMNADYFDRIESMQYVLNHDDGQSTRDLERADVVLVGVSRTSKTPTCIYLANRGIKAANVPIVPECPLPEDLFNISNPLVVGLIKDAKRLIEIRRQRLKFLNQDENTDYVNPDLVNEEIKDSRKLFLKCGWPIINVSRSSIEETAATIIQMLNKRREDES